MLLIPLIRKEWYWSKRNILIVAFLLVLVPVALGASTASLQETVPEDIPVAVVPQDENVSENALSRAESGLSIFASPKRIDNQGSAAANRERAIERLEREEVYLIAEVPPGLLEPGSVRITLVFDGANAPLHQADSEIRGIARDEFNSAREVDPDIDEGNVTVTSEIHGDEKGLGEFLFPAYMLGLLLVLAFTYVPYTLRRDASVLDRVRLDSSLGSLIASKLLFLTGAMLVPLLSFHATGLALGYDVGTLSPVSLVVSTGLLLGTFLAAAMIAASIMLLTRFSDAGQSLNLLVLLGFVAVSAIAFPRGAVSPTRADVAQFLPTHHAAVTARSLLLRDVSVGPYLGRIGTVVAMLAVAAVLLVGAINYYRRTS
jgi:ABC-2 type transport system permease protein